MCSGDVVQSLYDAFARGDIGAALGLLDPAVEWIEADGFPYAGTHRGPDGVLNGVFMRLGTEWDGYQAVPDEIVDRGDRVISLGHYSGTYKATGKSFRAPFAHAWTVRDSKIVRFVQYTDTVLVQRALQS